MDCYIKDESSYKLIYIKIGQSNYKISPPRTFIHFLYQISTYINESAGPLKYRVTHKNIRIKTEGAYKEALNSEEIPLTFTVEPILIEQHSPVCLITHN